MLDTWQPDVPTSVDRIAADTRQSGFTMASDLLTGALLRTLAASRPGGALLELGTGTGLATAWLLAGMDTAATLTSVDNDEAVVAIARRHLGHDRRLTLKVTDGAAYLTDQVTAGRGRFDLVFADAWPGKYTNLDEALALLKAGGIYVIDDMRPQPNWPPEHPIKVERLIRALHGRRDFAVTGLDWSTGIMIATRIADR